LAFGLTAGFTFGFGFDFGDETPKSNAAEDGLETS
jgi:hypothetical protein